MSTATVLRVIVGSVLVVGHVAAAAQVTKPEEVRSGLSGLGYEVEDGKTSDGRPIYSMTWKADGWTFALDASLTPDRKLVWLVMRLAKVDDPKKAPAEALFNILAENDRIAPMSYSWDAKTQTFFLNLALDARDCGPKTLRSGIDSMVESVKRTADWWDPSRWKD